MTEGREKNPRISVIVPVYNLKEYLPRCVESLTGQTFSDLEILLVDDGSTDGSSRLCDELKERDGRIRVIHKQNGGLVSAWKRGVKESRGEYLCFVDGDDWVDTRMLEILEQQLTGEGNEIIAGDYVIERPEGGEPVYQSLPPGAYDRRQLQEQVFPILLGNENRTVTFSRCMKLISRRLIETNQGYSEENLKMGEDLAVMLPALLDCDRLVALDHKAFYHYFYNPASMVHKYDAGMYENVCRLRRIMDRILSDRFEGEELTRMKRSADQEFLHLLLLVLKNEARGNREGYRKNILSVCRQPRIRELCGSTPITLSQRANKLLYLTLKHPCEVTVRLLRLAMILYYRKV